jgi:hypothetical protein
MLLTLHSAKNATQLVAESIQAEHEGVLFRGRGLVEWNPDEGVKIDGLVDRVTGHHPRVMHFGGLRFRDPTRYKSLRIRFPGGAKAVLFHSGLGDQFGLMHYGHLRVKLDGLISFEYKRHKTDFEQINMHFEGDTPVQLPHPAKRDDCIDERLVHRTYFRGLDWQDNDSALSVIPHADGTYAVYIKCSSTDNAWRLRSGFEVTWSFFSGKKLVPLFVSVTQPRRRIVELIARRESKSLNIFPVIDKNMVVHPHTLMRLTRFFSSSDVETHVARHLLDQCFIAAESSTWRARSFLISSGLEGAMRTLYGFAFQQKKGRDTFDLSACLKRFQSQYFSDEWSNAIVKVKIAFFRQRDRNAHLDWVTTTDGGLSRQSQVEMYNDLVTLSRFYGYVILAMAKEPGLKPDLPDAVEGN